MSAIVQARPPGLDHLQREERRRWAALAVVEDGDDPLVVAERVGVLTSTVHAWARDYRAAGAEGLAPRAVTHTPPQLDAARTRHLLAMLVDADPRDHGYSPALWSRDLVRTLVADRFRVALSSPATVRLLRRLSIALRRPRENLRPAAGARGCVRFSVSSGPLAAEMVVRFLDRLCTDAAGPLVVVGAGAVYDSPEVGAYLESTRGRVRLHRGWPLPEERR